MHILSLLPISPTLTLIVRLSVYPYDQLECFWENAMLLKKKHRNDYEDKRTYR